jgi:hypothetical protein
MKRTPRRRNPLLWLFEPLEDDPRFVQRKLFSFDAAYLDGRLYIAAKDGKEPTSGLLVCTYREHHEALLKEFPQCSPTSASRNGFTFRKLILISSAWHKTSSGLRLDETPGWVLNQLGSPDEGIWMLRYL